jgi:hypothetical protein
MMFRRVNGESFVYYYKAIYEGMEVVSSAFVTSPPLIALDLFPRVTVSIISVIVVLRANKVYIILFSKMRIIF